MLKVTERVPFSPGTGVFLSRLIFQTDTQKGSLLPAGAPSGDLA